MAPSAVSPERSDEPAFIDTTVLTLRKTLTSETAPLAQRFRALFSLKHLAAQQPPTQSTLPAIEAIAAAFSSPSALLKHELAYCLGQSKNDAAVAPLKRVLEDKEEDSMCRHEAAEALGALGDLSSLPLLKELRDDVKEPEVVRETCDIAVDRIEWEHSEARKNEILKQRYVDLSLRWGLLKLTFFTATLHQLILPLQPHKQIHNLPFQSSRRLYSTPSFHSSYDIVPCLHSETSVLLLIFLPRFLLCNRSLEVSMILRLFSAMKLPLSLVNSHTQPRSPVS